MSTARVEQTHWAGIDWGDDHHCVHVVDDRAKTKTAFQVEHTDAGLVEMCVRLRAFANLAGVAIETTRHVVVRALLDAALPVYPINPKMAHAWIKGESVSGAKSDPTDAGALARGLAQHHARLRPLALDDDATRTLGFLCRDEMALIAQQTAFVNQLQACLKEYYPLAISWFGDWTTLTAWDFVATFPRPEDLRTATRRKLVGFLKRHRLGLTPQWLHRIDRERKDAAWPSDPALSDARADYALALVKMLHTLRGQLKAYRKRIETLFAQHPDAALFRSLPGAGAKLAPRLLAAFGSDRERYESAHALQQLGGCVPVTRQSGKTKHVTFRRACQTSFRATLHLFAQYSRQYCVWAEAAYQDARHAGHKHGHALRILASKWLKIIYAMWVTHTAYDDGYHLARLIRRGSPVIDTIRRSGKLPNLQERA
jgi:transposase